MSNSGHREPIIPGTSGEPPDPRGKRRNSQELVGKNKRGPGRPRKNSINTNTSTPTVNTEYMSVNDTESVSGVSTENSYDGLNDDDMGDFIYQNRKHRSRTGTKKPPPIIVPDISPHLLEQKLKTANLPSEKIMRKVTPQGTKLFVNTKDEFKLLDSYLDSQQIKTFSYTKEEDLTSKFVLKKLPDMDINDIRTEMTKYKINPVDIKKFHIKKPKYTGQMHFLVYFKKSEGITLNHLKSSITGLFNYLVQFEPYRRNKSGPTQCKNCQAFGHSFRNCKLNPRCVRCSDPHKSELCDKINKDTNKIPDNLVMCANCQGSHTANFSKCPNRLKLIDKNNEREKRINTGFRASHFPSLNFRRPQVASSFPPTYANILNGASQTPNNLFSPEELLKIFIDIVEISRECKSKTEQILSLAKIFDKYFPNKP